MALAVAQAVARAVKLAAKLVARIEVVTNSRRVPNQRHPNRLLPNHQLVLPDYSAVVVELAWSVMALAIQSQAEIRHQADLATLAG